MKYQKIRKLHIFNRFGVVFFLLLFLPFLSVAEDVSVLFVAENTSGHIKAYNASDGTFVADIGTGLAITADTNGNHYVSNGSTVHKYGDDGSDLGVFATNAGLVGAEALHFAANSNLFVSSTSNKRIYEFNGTNGDFVRYFYLEGGTVRPGGGGITTSPYNDHMLISSASNDVQEFEFVAGVPTFTSNLVTAASGGLTAPQQIEFGPTGSLFVASHSSWEVLEYNETNGTSKGTFIFNASYLANPVGLALHPVSSNLFVSSFGRNRILECNGETGAFINTDWGGLMSSGIGPRYLAFGTLKISLPSVFMFR